jgi:hypothetical protein
MIRSLSCMLLALTLAGCDLAGTAVATGAGASAEMKQAQQAKQTEDQVRQNLDDAMHAHREQIDQAEKDSQ